MSVEPDKCSETGFVAPRVKKGILTLTSENTLNIGDSTTRFSKKRKWSSVVLEDLLEEPFLIRVGLELEYQFSLLRLMLTTVPANRHFLQRLPARSRS